MSRPLARLALSLGLWLCASAWAAAQTFTLSGTVFGGGNPLPGAAVEALQDGTTVVAASATTDSVGRYSVSVAAGTYDLRVSPPSGSGYGQEVIQNIVVSANTSHDVILLSANLQATLSGTVRGYGGQPVQGAYVQANSATTGESFGQLYTGADGRYSLTVTQGVIHLYTYQGGTSPYAPANWHLYRYNLTVGGDLQIDTDLPVVRVSGLVTDSNGAPVPNVNLSASGSYYDGGPRGFNGSVNSTADGSYSFLAFQGSSSVTLTPPGGSPYARFTESLNLTADLERTFVMPIRVTAIVSGTVRGYGGQPVQGAYVQANSATTGESFGQLYTGADGRYSLTVTQGVIHLYTYQGGTSPYAPANWHLYRYNLTVGGDLQIDTDLPVVRVSGLVTDSNGAPVPNVNLSASGSYYDGGPRGFNGSVNSAADGSYSFLAFQGSASVTLTPPGGSPYARFTESLNLTADLERTFVMPIRVTAIVSGTVRGYGGQPVQGAYVQANSATTGESFGQLYTGADGRYSLTVTQGVIHLYTYQGGTSPYAPANWHLYRYNLTVGGDLQIDTDLPVVRVSGLVTDSNGAPVPNVNLSASGSYYDGGPRGFNGSVNSAADGSYSFLAFQGSASFQIRPPQGSGFASTNLNGVNLTGDLAQSIVLQRPDAAPPQIVAGPVVIHLSDTSVSIAWTTNEPANSAVEFGVGSLQYRLTSNVLRTEHSVTLIDLDAQAIYSFRVASTDRSGNGPVVSPIGTFTTQEPPGDITPPVFTSAPAVVFVDQTTAIVQWTTDEPATSRVEFGPSDSLGTSRTGVGFERTHSIVITGLTANTSYFAMVRSTDPDGNVSESGLFSFHTLDVPDTQAPAITAGPTFSLITDRRVTVSWTTDEPATSGVSYNDGTLFNVVTDDTLTEEHSITLSGLTPQTTYHVTVSSRDAVSNGPTLAGPADVTTAATPDTTAPVISNRSVDNITESSAVVSWMTDEPATGVVRYGVAGLDHQVADISFVTAHEFSLTGLAENTTYSLVVRSTDASGNAMESLEMTFTTLSSVVDTPPTAASALAATPNPNNTGMHTLVWVAASDVDGPIAGYEVFRDGVSVALLSATETSYAEDGLPEGTYSYLVRAVDGGGHSADSDGYAVVVDTTAPVLGLPTSIATPATTPTNAVVTYEATATDDRGGSPVVDCSPESGSSFAIGVTTVECTATDDAGNVASGDFLVTVNDVFPPVLTIPASMTVDATSPSGAVVFFTASAVDNVDPNPAVTCSPAAGTTFAIGTTSVSCTARDTFGNTSPPSSFQVTVASATEQIDDTELLLISFELPDGVANSLQSKLVAAESAPNSGCSQMNAFMNQVTAQSGKALTPAQAAQLLSAAAQIMEVMGCR